MEIFDVCDELGNPTGRAVSRQEAHDKGICHRTAHVWIVRMVEGRYQVLLQRRSMQKDSFPGQLDTSSAGHIPTGQTPVASAVRELKEELGIRAEPEDLEFAGQLRIKYEAQFHGKPFRDNEVANIYIYQKKVNIDYIVVQKEEIDSVGWYDLEETYQRCLKPRDPEYCVPIGGLKVIMEKLGCSINRNC